MKSSNDNHSTEIQFNRTKLYLFGGFMKFAFAIAAALAATTIMATKAQAHGGHCATIYQGPNFSGYSRDLSDGTYISRLSDIYMGDGASWDNRISSVVVERGCRLVGFQYENFGRDYYSGQPIGFKAVFDGYRLGRGDRFDRRGRHENAIDLQYTQYNDMISSLHCDCR